ncbi:MAG: hypothetical protein LBD49_04655 [Oscillospiraceae bacterium]|jgi:hypothetical protein|nr:hypothetical protein [Oscillospiraceae bacterium]
MWNEITDAESFFDAAGFGDVCLKELKYLGGIHEGSPGRTYLCDDVRVVRMLFVGYSNIELEFRGLVTLHLQPRPELYSTEICWPILVRENDLLYWAESDDFDVRKASEYEGTWLCAKSARWRKRGEIIGVEPVYIDREMGGESADFLPSPNTGNKLFRGHGTPDN